MKIYHIIFIFIIISLSACSWITELALINESKDPVKISYYIKSDDNKVEAGIQCPTNSFYFNPPKIIPIEIFGKSMLDEYPDCQYEFDEKNRTITTIIPPGKALWVDRTTNWGGNVSEFRFCRLALNKIVIEQSGRKTVYEGLELLEAFDKYYLSPFNDSLYAIIIK